MMNEMKVLRQKIQKYEGYIQDLEGQLGDLSQKEHQVNKQLEEVLRTKRSLTPPDQSMRDSSNVKVIQLESQLQKAQERVSQLEKQVQRTGEYEQAYRSSAKERESLKSLQNDNLSMREEIEILIDRVKEQDREIKKYLLQIQDYQREVTFMKEIVRKDESLNNSSMEHSVDGLKRRIIELENKCALLATENTRLNQIRVKIKI